MGIPPDVRVRKRHFIGKSCLSKRRYATRESAETVLKRYKGRKGTLHTYGPCKFCGGFHLGHARGD